MSPAGKGRAFGVGAVSLTATVAAAGDACSRAGNHDAGIQGALVTVRIERACR